MEIQDAADARAPRELAGEPGAGDITLRSGTRAILPFSGWGSPPLPRRQRRVSVLQVALSQISRLSRIQPGFAGSAERSSAIARSGSSGIATLSFFGVAWTYF